MRFCDILSQSLQSPWLLASLVRRAFCDDVSLLGVSVGVRFEREGGVVLFKASKAQRVRSTECSECVICKGEQCAVGLYGQRKFVCLELEQNQELWKFGRDRICA